jgi:phosphoribosylformylglycinamidine cyclo-ligase
MRRTFNLGIGMIVAVSPAQVDAARSLLAAEGETVYRIGQVADAAAPDGPVEFVG